GDRCGRFVGCDGDGTFDTASGDLDITISDVTAGHRLDVDGAELLGADLAGSDVAQADVDGFVGVGTHLESGGTEGTVQQLAATEAGGFGDTVQLGGQLAELGLQGLALVGAIGTVGCLQGQFAHALQDGGGLTHGRFGGLRDGDAVVGVLHGNVQTIDRKSTRLNSSHVKISYAVFCLKKK